jgi:putative ABC transport system permease protein
MNLTGLALRNLRRRPVRTILTVLSVAVAVAVLFSLLMFNTGYQRALRGQLQQMGVHLMVVPIGCPYEAASLVLEGGRIKSYLDADVADRIAGIEGVQIAAPQLMQAIVRPEDGRTDIYLGIDDATLQLKNWWRLDGTEARPTADLLKEPDAVLLGNDAALIEQREAVGELLWVPEIESEFKVSGILAATGSQDDGFFYVPLKTAQEKFNHGSQLTAVQIRLSDPALAPEIADTLETMFPNAQVIRMEELLGSMTALMGSAQALIFAIVIVVVMISAVGVLNTVLMSVFERTREIGILRATGAGRTDVFSLIWTETLLMALAGGAGGLLLAAVGAPVVETVIRKFVPMVPAESVLQFEPRTAVLCVLVVLGVAIVAGTYPALRAATGRTIEALRTE